MLPYLTPLEAAYQAHANTEAAGAMAAYLKNKFAFYGIRMSPRRELCKAFLAEYGLPPAEQLEAVVRQCWSQPQREWHYFAQDLLVKFIKKSPPETIELLQWLITNNSWWDTVDHIAVHLVGPLVQRHPHLIQSHLNHWIRSEDMWLQRTCILFQLRYKDTTNTQLMFRYMEGCFGSKEFFINKAIGWALREYSRTNADAVKAFVAANERLLAPLSRKEALRLMAV